MADGQPAEEHLKGGQRDRVDQWTEIGDSLYYC
jgi:hypothetical protein